MRALIWLSYVGGLHFGDSFVGRCPDPDCHECIRAEILWDWIRSSNPGHMHRMESIYHCGDHYSLCRNCGLYSGDYGHFEHPSGIEWTGFLSDGPNCREILEMQSKAA